MMTEDTNDFWQSHSLKYLEMAFKTDKCEIIAAPDGYGKKTGDCGDTTEIFLKTRGETIETVSFHTTGCMNTTACANTVALLVEGKTIGEAWEIAPEAVADYLETLPGDHFHCAELAVGALYMALSNYNELQRSPWKKPYQTRSKN
jgi:nitrogen fixation protein NifU and related proteins